MRWFLINNLLALTLIPTTTIARNSEFTRLASQLDSTRQMIINQSSEVMSFTDSLLATSSLMPYDSLFCEAKLQLIISKIRATKCKPDSLWKTFQTNCIQMHSNFEARYLISFGNYLSNNEIGDYGLTQHYQALQIAKQNSNVDLQIAIYQNLASTYYSMDSIAQASSMLQKRLALQKNENDASERFETTVSLLVMAFEAGDSAKTEVYAKQSLGLAKLTGNPTHLLFYYVNYASALRAFNKPEKAIALFQKSIMLADSLGHRISYSARLGISYSYEDLGMFKEAYDYYSQADLVGDSIQQVDYAESITEMNIKYQTEKKAREIEALKQQKEIDELEKRWLFGLATFLGFAILGVILFFRNRAKNRRKLQEEKIQKLEKENEVMVLQSMLFAQEEERQRIARDLHDGIGALLSTARMQINKIESDIAKLAEIDLVKDTEEIIQRAGREVRRVAHDMMPGVLSELGLTEAIEDFIGRLSNTGIAVAFTYDEMPERFSNDVEIMAYRIVQELVNNAIKHSKADEIKLMLKYDEKNLIVDYRDDGVGFDSNALTKTSNVGLSSLKSRVNFLNGQIKLQTSPNNGVHYQITLPTNNG